MFYIIYTYTYIHIYIYLSAFGHIILLSSSFCDIHLRYDLSVTDLLSRYPHVRKLLKGTSPFTNFVFRVYDKLIIDKWMRTPFASAWNLVNVPFNDLYKKNLSRAPRSIFPLPRTGATLLSLILQRVKMRRLRNISKW